MAQDKYSTIDELDGVRFSFSDLVHYDRHDPAFTQDVYFDVSPKRADLIASTFWDCVTEVEAGRTEPIETVTILKALQVAWDKLGPLSIPEILFAVHDNAYDNGQQAGIYQGYMKGKQDAEQQFGAMVLQGMKGLPLTVKTERVARKNEEKKGKRGEWKPKKFTGGLGFNNGDAQA